MNNIILFLCAMVMFNNLSFAQAQPEFSIHKYHSEQYRTEDYQRKPNRNAEQTEIIPLQYDKSKELDAVVFGYLPDWEYQDSERYLQYDLLTHIACFDFPVDRYGNLGAPYKWPWTTLINKAHENGVKVILCVTNFEGSEIHNIIASEFAKNTFFNNIKSKVKAYNLDGVNIDFEGVNSSDRGVKIPEFMKELTDMMHTEFPGSEVSFAGPAVNWGGWNFTSLANSCDYIFIMGYAYYGGWSTTTGPTGPLTGGSYNVYNTVTSQYSAVTENMPEKLILGCPYYGEKYLARSTTVGASVIDNIGTPRFREAQSGALQNGGWIFSSKFNCTYYHYPSGTPNQHVQVWCDNDASLGLKIDLAVSRNLRGVGMWALGYDGNRLELWNKLREKLYTPSGVEETQTTVPETFMLEQNFPNPFNPETNIRFHLAEASYTTLKVYDILGREVATLFDRYAAKGIYTVSFGIDDHDLTSGIYFYRLISGNEQYTRKMILLE